MVGKALRLVAASSLIVIFMAGCGSNATLVKSSRYDNVNVKTYPFSPQGAGKYPGVIVLHTIGGMKDHVSEFARKLSEQGYVALAVDYFSGRGSIGYEKTGYDQHIRDAYNWLKTQPNVDADNIAFVGFSLGPRKAFRLTSRFRKKVNEGYYLDAKAIVSHYVGRLHYSDPPKLSMYPPILFLHGDRDQETPADKVKAFCADQNSLNNGNACEHHFYPNVYHAYDHPTKKYDGYSSETTEDSFKRTVKFLDKHLKL